MDKLFNNIYNLTYNHLVTPYNLLNNLKLENYHEINFRKNNLEIIAEIKCTVDKQELTFEYIFDNNNFLKQVAYFSESNKNILFDREAELTQERNKFIRKVNVQKKVI